MNWEDQQNFGEQGEPKGREKHFSRRAVTKLETKSILTIDEVFDEI